LKRPLPLGMKQSPMERLDLFPVTIFVASRSRQRLPLAIKPPTVITQQPRRPQPRRRPTQTTPSSRASTNSSTTDWLSSLTPSVAGPSSDPPTPSSRGRAARYASIVTAIEELTLEPSFVVIQGVSPGVYTDQCVSTCLFISLRLPPSC
jgi:hypothetical protein